MVCVVVTGSSLLHITVCHGSRVAAIYVTPCARLLLSLSAGKDSVHSNAVVLLLQC